MNHVMKSTKRMNIMTPLTIPPARIPVRKPRDDAEDTDGEVEADSDGADSEVTVLLSGLGVLDEVEWGRLVEVGGLGPSMNGHNGVRALNMNASHRLHVPRAVAFARAELKRLDA